MNRRSRSTGLGRWAIRWTECALLLALTACGGSGSPSQPPAGNDDDPPPAPTGNHTFAYAAPDAAPSISSLQVRGTFNDWGSTAMQLGVDDVWRATLDLPNGETQYKFFVNGGWIDDMCYDETWGDPANGWVVDPSARGCVSDGYTGRNAVVFRGAAPLDFSHQPGSVTDVSGVAGRVSIRFRARADEVLSAALVSGSDTVPMHRQLRTDLTDWWRVLVDPPAGSYGFEVVTAAGTESFGPYQLPGQLFESVPWVAGSVGYQIFPDRFWNGDPTNDSLALSSDEYDFIDEALGGTAPTVTPWDGVPNGSHCCHQYFGGDLQGVIDRLPDLEQRGVTVLYFNPIWESGSAHGYDGFDFRRVASNFGDSTVLRTLVDEAHARGMKLIWDFVPNHVGIGHWAFQDALANGESSDYWDWFDFKVDAGSVQAGNADHYAAWWGFGSLPELQTGNPAVFDHLIGVATDWTRYGFDGIRVDVPFDIHNRGSFFPAWRQAVKAVNPEVYLIGEVWEQDPTWLRGDQFDALMNYAMGQGVVAEFARGDITAPVANGKLAGQYAAYPEASAAMGFNLMASHDTPRAATLLGAPEWGGASSSEDRARQRMAAAVLYALPGMPVTFQGDECGFLGGQEGLHLARYPVQWDRCDAEMLQHYERLAEIKHGTAALGTSAIRSWLDADGVLGFYRGEPGTGEVLAVFSNRTGPTTVSLPDGTWRDLATGSDASGQITLEAFGWRLLERR